ncbi:hypothetical protein FUA23_12260 [Neolewinella aurantiaca]|uniref:Uncharacterized protein n=1 Tax=Neolewinella aurantiaca TaxID=2602767 RepID=A0A5C7FH30_9BACT|nr:hypothetical protein [Neolewinella aurantiaca]TXF89053.1 hypothetical protein FUA23_12260 [Neolewinella aurantiaca]
MTTPNDNLYFQNVQSPLIREWFAETLARYPELHNRPIYLRKLSMKRSTMRAQPIINWSFFRRATRHYRVDFSDHLDVTKHVIVQDLPKEVVVGWFAHELGHIIDYLNRPVLGMISFGLGYALWSRYMRKAERIADTIAVEHGFGDEVRATKAYLLQHATLPFNYKRRLNKYYLSADELEGLILAWEQEQNIPEVVDIEE